MFNLQFKNWVNCVTGKCRKPTHEQLLYTVAELGKAVEELQKASEDFGTSTVTTASSVLAQNIDGGVGPLSNTAFNTKVVSAVNADPARLRVINHTANGGANVIYVPHGLSTTPSFYSAVGANAASAGVSYVTADATNVMVHFATATASGTNNIQVMVTYKV